MNEDIQRQIAALDKQFASAENCRTGKLKQDEYFRRRMALCERLRETEQDDQDARRVAQTRRDAPKHYVMASDDVRQLKAMTRDLKAATKAGNDGAALQILESEDYLRLLYLDELQDAGELSAIAYSATVGARVALAMKYISLAGKQRRDADARIAAVQTRSGALMMMLGNGANVDAIREFEKIEARVRALETSVPKYCGVWHDGTKAAHAEIYTLGGSMWIALRNTDTKPPSGDWQCCVQKGRGAR